MTAPLQHAGYTRLLVEAAGAVVTVRLNRPALRNALDRRTVYELIRILRRSDRDDSIRMVLLSGVGETFCAGVDFKQRFDQHYVDTANAVQRALVWSFVHCSKVLVAVVNGPCLGIGFALAALCDVVYASDGAYFQAPFTRLGMCPEAGASYLFPLVFGRAKAAEILYFGVKVSAAEALAYRFVAGLYAGPQAEAELWQRLHRYAAELKPQSLLAAKRLMGGGPLYAPLMEVMLDECKEMAVLRQTEAYRRTFAEFAARRRSDKGDPAVMAVNKSKL